MNNVVVGTNGRYGNGDSVIDEMVAEVALWCIAARAPLKRKLVKMVDYW